MTALISIWALGAILVAALVVSGIAHRKQQESIQIKQHLGQLRHQADDTIDTIDALQRLDTDNRLSELLNGQLLNLLENMLSMGDKGSFVDSAIQRARVRQQEFVHEKSDFGYIELESDGEISIAHNHLSNTERLLRRFLKRGKLEGDQYNSYTRQIQLLHLKIDVDVHKSQGDKYLAELDNHGAISHWQHALSEIRKSSLKHPLVEGRKLALEDALRNLQDKMNREAENNKAKEAAIRRRAVAKKEEEQREVRLKLDKDQSGPVRRKRTLATSDGPIFISAGGKAKQI